MENEKQKFLNLENFTMIENVNAKTFYNNFVKSSKTLNNKELVDIHSVNEYKTTKNYISKDGKSGFSITKSGDLISVFNSSNKRGFLKSIADIVKQNVKTLDCYKSKVQDLPTMYNKIFGFKIASVLDFNYDLLVELHGKEYTDNFVKLHGKAPVIFMVNTEKEVITILRSPHKHKDSREQFEMRTHKRVIDILYPTSKTMDSLMKLELPAGVDIEIKN